MNPILHVQIITLIIVMAAIILFAYQIVKGYLNIGLIAIGLLLLVNLGLFLTERIIIKTGILSIESIPFFSTTLVNAWAIAIQLQLALTALAVAAILLINGKVNGGNNEGRFNHSTNSRGVDGGNSDRRRRLCILALFAGTGEG